MAVGSDDERRRERAAVDLALGWGFLAFSTPSVQFGVKSLRSESLSSSKGVSALCQAEAQTLCHPNRLLPAWRETEMWRTV